MQSLKLKNTKGDENENKQYRLLNNWDSIDRDLTRSTLTIYGFKEDK